VTRYRLDARRFHGPLHAPERNDTEQHESDDLAALGELARRLVGEGFTVWLYERVRRAEPLPEAYDLRLLRQFTPGAGRADDPGAG
jgi:hypothetical protein